MRAVRTLSGQVHVVDVPMPQGDGIRVRIRSAGICSSDLHLIAAGWPITSTLGHEMAGELSDGTRVAIEPIAPCGHCDSCTRGEYSVCRRGAGMIYGVSQDGGMADEIIVPSRCLVRLPDGVPTSNACLVEPLAVALHGLRRVPLDPREPIAIVGAGSLGLCTAAMAKPYVSGVTLFARHDAQREAAAAKMGFSAYGLTQGDDPVAQAMKGLIDNASGHEHQIALLWQAIEKLGARTRELPAEDCVPQDAQTTEHFDAERLNRLVK